MSSGLPAVVTDWSGYRDTVIHNETGFRVTTRWADCTQEIGLFAPLTEWQTDHLRLSQSVAADVHELTRYLDILIGNAELRSSMGHAARKHILAHLSWSRVMGLYTALWQELSFVASELPQELPRYQYLQQPQYFQNFSHFASQSLNGSESLGMTDWGQHAYRHPETIVFQPGMRQTLDHRTMLVILKFVKMANSFNLRINLQEVCEKIAPRHHLTPQTALAHVMWLLKYGLLRVV